MSRPSQLRDIWARYRRNKLAMVGLVVVVILVITAIVGDYLTPYDAFEQNLLNARAPSTG
jgi:peptide/nickel transport system permease protein